MRMSARAFPCGCVVAISQRAPPKSSLPLQFQISGAKVEFDWLRAKHTAIFYPMFFATKTKRADRQKFTNKK